MVDIEYDERILALLIEKAKLKNCDSLFIAILKNKPIYPINYTNYEIQEFGNRIKFCGDSNTHGIEHGSVGYILGYAPPTKGIREMGWYEVVFPYVDHNANPSETVNGLLDKEFKLDVDD